MDGDKKRLAIIQEWMINPDTPTQTLSRLRRRATYGETTLWWLVNELGLLDKNPSQIRVEGD